MAVKIWTGASSGVFGTAGNWTGGAPGTGDTAIIPAYATVNIAGGAYATAFDKLIVEPGCSITIGTNGTPLDVTFAGETNASVEFGGTGLTYLKTTEAKTITVTSAAGSPSTGQYGFNLTTGDASTNECTLRVNASPGQSISVAANPGETAEIKTITMTGGDVAVGASVTGKNGTDTVAFTVSGGTLVNKSPAGFTQYGGDVYHKVGAIGAALIYGGEYHHMATEAATQIIAYDGGTVDLDQNIATKNISALLLEKGGTIKNMLNTHTAAVSHSGRGYILQAS
jgi:hypothetical protein